jgi:rubrerythrin
MALQDLPRDWWQRLTRRQTIKNPSGVPKRRCAECGYENSGVGPEPETCPRCQNPWRSA